MKRKHPKSRKRKPDLDFSPRDFDEKREEKVSISGILAASEWDDNGNPIEIKLLSTDDREYAVENSAMFLNMLRKYVEATGIVRDRKHGVKTMEIKRCTVLDDDSPKDPSDDSDVPALA